MNEPLHERIRREIERRILSGSLAPGARLPTEQEIMVAYGCSRMTVSKALQPLAAAGLVVRRKRAGTFVARPESHSMMMDIPDLERDVRARGEAYRFEVSFRRSREPRNEEERRLSGRGMLVEIEGVHVADGRPFATERRLINPAAAPGAELRDWAEQSPGAWLLDHVPWTEAESRVLAIKADAKTAKKLDIPTGEACLALERRTWRRQKHITQVRQVFVPGAIDLVARFGPRLKARAV